MLLDLLGKKSTSLHIGQEHSESADLRQGSPIPGLSSKSTLKLSGYNFLYKNPGSR